MLWFIFALVSSAFTSSRAAFSKRAMFKTNEYIAAFSLRFFSLPFLLPLIFFIDLTTDIVFWYALAAWGVMAFFGSIIYMKALKLSPISLTMSIPSFTPVFMLITSPLILGEFPTIGGIIGIILVVIGSYLLNVKDMRKGLFSPIQSLLKEKGCMLMLVLAFIWSITANIDKIGVVHSNPILYTIASQALMTILLFPLLFLKRNKDNKNKISVKELLPIGIFSALSLITQMYALQLTLAAYVVAVKRTSGIFSTAYGKYMFKEKRITERILGATIMIIGVLFIVLL